MGLPAPVPNEPLPAPAVEPAEWPELQREGTELIDDARRMRPADRSVEESVLLARLGRFGVRSFKALGVSFLEVVRSQL